MKVTQDTFQEVISAWVKAELDRSGRTATWLAESMKLAQPTLCRALNMQRALKLGEVAKIARLLRKNPPGWNIVESSPPGRKLLSLLPEIGQEDGPMSPEHDGLRIDSGPFAGQYAVCGPIPADGIKDGDLVLLERAERKHGDMVLTKTIRRARVGKEIQFHSFDGTDGKFLDPRAHRVRMIGKVVGFFSPI